MTDRASDFLRGNRTPAGGWILLAAGIAALVAALWWDGRWTAQREAQQREGQQRWAAQRVLRQPPPVAPPTEARRRWQQVQPELRRPWLPTLRAIEAATVHPIVLLSMTVDPAGGVVRLDAEAPSFDHALAYVQVLDTGGALRPAVLLSHEQTLDAGSGRSVVHFSVATSWIVR